MSREATARHVRDRIVMVANPPEFEHRFTGRDEAEILRWARGTQGEASAAGTDIDRALHRLTLVLRALTARSSGQTYQCIWAGR